MHPINYSFVMNVLTLLVCAGLSVWLAQPLLVVIALVMQTHALERFNTQPNQPDQDDDEPCIGFNANVGRN